MTVIVVVAAVLLGVAAAVVVVVVGNRMVRSGEGGAGGFADGLGMALDVFDPARGRARQELEDQKHQGAIIPSPGEDDRPLRVDLTSGRVTVRRAERTPFRPGARTSRAGPARR